MVVQLMILLSLIGYWILKRSKHMKIPEDFPPGPPAVPLLGVLPFVKGNFKQAIQGWKDVYGDVVGFQLGNELAVVVSDFDKISETFKDSRFTGRSANLQEVMSAFFASTPSENNGGIVFTHGQEWSEQRRFALRTLRDFGFGKSTMETVIQQEVNKFSMALSQKQDNCSTSLVQLLSVSVVNSIWTILTGEKIDHGDRTVQEIVTGTEEFIKNESLSGPIMMFPWLRHLPGIRGKFLATKEAPLKMRKLQNTTVAKHKEALRTIHEAEKEWNNNQGESDKDDDFIAAYLRKIRETTDPSSSFYGDKGHLNLQRSLTDLFGAGTETSSSLLLFAFLYMIKYPEEQKKIQEEIESVVGPDEQVSLKHRNSLPYTDAALYEILRHACLVYTVPHATTCDINKYQDQYFLPKGTAVYANVWNVMHSEDYWQDPEAFRPSRFVSQDGKFRRDDRCIPFMLGKRFCIGQSLAEIQLFLFFAGILQKFEFQAPNGPDQVSTDPIVGFLHSCPSYDVLIRQRQ